MDEARARKLKKIEELRKRSTQKPDWSGLMKEINGLKFNKNLKKVVCNDRSRPLLATVKIQGKVSYHIS